MQTIPGGKFNPAVIPTLSWRQLGLSPSAQRLVPSSWIRSRDAGLRRLRRATRGGR
jgi:hypothetical protein